MKVLIRPEITISLHPDESMWWYMSAGWMIPSLLMTMILTLLNLKSHTVFSIFFPFIVLSFLGESFILAFLIRKIRKRMEQDADELVRYLKNTLKEGED